MKDGHAMLARRKKSETRDPALAPSVSVIEGEQGTVLFDARRGEYYQVNELGLLIVRALGEGLGSEAIVERVVDAYDVSLDVAAEDVRNFLLQMKELEVVK